MKKILYLLVGLILPIAGLAAAAEQLPKCSVKDKRTPVPRWESSADLELNLAYPPPQSVGMVVFLRIILDDQDQSTCERDGDEGPMVFSYDRNHQDLDRDGLKISVMGQPKLLKGQCELKGLYTIVRVQPVGKKWTEVFYEKQNLESLQASEKFCRLIQDG
ncbi:hypothetical protein [Flexibacterium corallicola]|uniref:hypothetical protein n=1 Tax=Flexibacterium corallicola TaxID=3037259 RepID=UPI00286F7E83|nr:hypothetical protein [Pseudovibrio sp. M1P-2-3]